MNKDPEVAPREETGSDVNVYVIRPRKWRCAVLFWSRILCTGGMNGAGVLGKHEVKQVLLDVSGAGFLRALIAGVALMR